MMKRVVLATVAIAIAATCTTAATRKVLMEEFTNVRCGPCYTHDPWMIQFVDNHYPTDLSVIYYHMYWPGYDPFHYNNEQEQLTRRGYYSVNAVPSNRQDGFEPPSYPYTLAVLEQRHQAALAVPTDLAISLSGTWYGAATGDLRVELDAEADIALDNMVIHVGLAERDVFWDGVSGYDNHDFLLRYFVTGNTGEPLAAFTSGENRVLDYEWDFWEIFDSPDDLLGTDPVFSNLALVVWVQDNTTKQVIQSESLEVTDMTVVAVGDASVMLAGQLGQNRPNPFNPTTSIPITMNETAPAVVRIYGPNGSLVRTLTNGVLPAGVTSLNWDGRDLAGREVASGVYYVNLEVGDESVTRPMTLLK